MTEKQKWLFREKITLEHPELISKKKVATYYARASIERKINKINAVARKAEVNELEEIGVTADNFRAISEAINVCYENNGLSADRWAHTPRLRRTRNYINTKFKVHMEDWHFFVLLISMRKMGVLSTFSFEKGKKKKKSRITR